jgi:uncharacterized protein (TIGR00288 family)
LDTPASQPRIALLIDFDNVFLGVDDPPGFDIELVVNALRLRGVVVLGRAYGDWYRHSRHRRKLMEQGIELVETPAFGPIIKNAADIRIALDGLEIGMTQHHINEFCLVSGDSDFLPLIKKLQYLGKTVVVISGNKFTSDLVRRNCNEFISYENLLAESVGALEDATSLEGAFSLLSRTILSLHERGMEVRSSTVKQMMLQLNPVFSERNFGCSQFKQFLDKGCRAGIIKLGRRDPNSGEYTVLLPSDFDDEKAEEPRAQETPKPAPRSRRKQESAPPRVEASGEDLGLREISGAEAIEESSTDEAASTPSANGEGAAGRALRRGRLRFSGKTWKGGSRSVLQVGPNGEASEGQPEADQSESASSLENAEASQDESTPVASEMQGEEVGEAVPVEAVEEETDEAAGEDKSASRKRGARGGRRRKAATKTAVGETPEEGAGDETSEAASEPAQEAVAEAPDGAANEPEAEAGKTAAKKPARRRRAPAKKKAE